MPNQHLTQSVISGQVGAAQATRPAKLEPEWMEISSAFFAWRTALWLTLMVLGAWLSLHTGATATVCGILVLGVAMAHGVELSHQALHYTGFRSPRLNEFFGVAMGLPMLVSFYEYRINHLKHHALLGTPMNREFFDYGSETWTPKGLALRFLMLHHYKSFCTGLVKALLGRSIDGLHVRYQGQVRLFYVIAAVALATLTAACWVTAKLDPLLIWLTALFIVASPLHAFIEMPEHYSCNANSTDAFENTRTIKSNWFMTWLTNSNNFHVEHHLWSNVPIQKIHKLHERCRDRSQHLNTGYWQFYISALRDARRNVNT
ncbi:fatty acid desaturase family protein [Paraherbaspirillum soli]|uniref:Fatty acid desaturase family protein n=1 Tax=Paraherbaspirillum soli TaxID=631222 RepID=A0ABW0ME62_9BURK